MGIFKVGRIALDYIGVDSILFDRAIPEIFYFKYDVDASDHSDVLVFIGNPDVDSLSVAISVLT